MSGRCLVLDNEAVQALLDPHHPKHRRCLEIMHAAARRKTRVVVPTAVRVEAGWDRTMPTTAVVNRQGIVDHLLDDRSANLAAKIATTLNVSVADGHLGAALSAAPEGNLAVATSDLDDVKRISAFLGRDVSVLRV